ncbi:MAG: GH92 family glycosyl hydrolase [Elusimicrobia bacterium]|nr:GH92 family glycosyl hydrolase [Elusimicrobiota bacterium]
MENSNEAVDYVNTVIGTPMAGFTKDLDGGGTMPCVGNPYAMTNFTAQTRENRMNRMPYVYEDPEIIGFMATHQPTVWMGDYGYVSVMPQVGKLRALPEERALKYSHDEETARPHYYSVSLDAGGGNKIRAEIAAASRAGIFRFTFPEAEEARLIIQGINLNPKNADWANDYASRLKSLKGYVKVDKEKNEITGYNPDRMSAQLGPELPSFRGYFIIRFDKKMESSGTWDCDTINVLSAEQYGTRMGAYAGFKTKKGEKIKVKIGTSFISLEQAGENMQKEIPDWDFDRVVKETRDNWQHNLSRIAINGAAEDQKTVFYTAMFHALLFPREFSEYGRYYSAFDDKVHEGTAAYNDYSLWDTFRALHPLLILIQPERVNPMIRSLLQIYKEGGWLPMWPNPAETNIMIGTHADAVIADAWVKGFRGYDTELAYEAVRKDSMVPPDNDTKRDWGDRDPWTGYEARGGLSYYHSLGYVPVDKTRESVSRTLEYAYDDFCVSRLAKDLGKTEDYERLTGWSKNYANLYNKRTGFMAPRLYNGAWHDKPDEGFTEGSPWTYLFCVMQDVPGMIDLMGGKEKFTAKLDENFAGGHYRHDNEPGHHYIYLYDYAGQPWKTQELARKHTTVNFRSQPLGINGNDDCGQMSAWYIFSVMGFYPVTPGTDIYAIGAPQFPELTLNLTADGKPRKLEIIAKDLSEENKYVQSVELNGKPVTTPFLSHSDIIGGGSLVFTMGKAPNYDWK